MTHLSSIRLVLGGLGALLALSAMAESFLFDRLSGLAGPFEGVDAAGRAFLVEKLGDVGAIPLYAYWTSDESAPHGVLGPGWHIPLLESRIMPVDEKTYEFLQPDGLKRDIRVSRDNPEVLTSPRVWSGRAKGDEISLQGDIGGGERIVLSFRKGRLARMKTEEGTFDFGYSGRHLEKINSRGQNLLTVVRDARGGSKAEFQFAGKGSVAVERGADSLSMTWPDGLRKTFTRGVVGNAESLKVGDLTVTWDRYSKRLGSYGGWSYTFGERKPEWNNPSISRLNLDGRQEFYWFNLANGKGEYREADGTQYKWARFPAGDLYGLMRWSEKTRKGALLHRNDYSYDSRRRIVFHRLSRGTEEREGNSLPAREERWYAEDGKVRRLRLDGKDMTP
ncbi:MAG: hypothetical protein Q4G65_00505 [bacterium]|nr:hypothetical protein [bacterium]